MRRRSKALVWIAAVLVAAPLGLFATFHLARSRTMQLFGRIVPRVETRERLVALTFDDGPAPEPIDEVLSVLASRGVHSTFFVNGANLERHPELGRRLLAAGHELGNHTYAHERMVLKSPAFIRSEVERTDALIRAAGQDGAIPFRPPFGWKLVGLSWHLARTGRTTVTWDVDADAPPAGHDAEQIVATCLPRVRPGSIVLLHPWYAAREPSRRALPVLVDRLQADGFRLVTVRELLAIIQIESGFDQRARSRKSARGLMQLMPGTARDMGARNAFDPRQNIFAGVRYLRFLLDAFEGDVTLATAAYNAGPTVVKRYGGVPPYEETQNYVERVHGLLGLPTLPWEPSVREASLVVPDESWPATVPVFLRSLWPWGRS